MVADMDWWAWVVVAMAIAIAFVSALAWVSDRLDRSECDCGQRWAFSPDKEPYFHSETVCYPKREHMTPKEEHDA